MTRPPSPPAVTGSLLFCDGRTAADLVEEQLGEVIATRLALPANWELSALESSAGESSDETEADDKRLSSKPRWNDSGSSTSGVISTNPRTVVSARRGAGNCSLCKASPNTRKCPIWKS